MILAFSRRQNSKERQIKGMSHVFFFPLNPSLSLSLSSILVRNTEVFRGCKVERFPGESL